MANEPTLYARMELRLNDFEKKLARATKSTDQTMKRIEARGDQMTAHLSGLGTGAFAGLAKGAALTLAPILSVGAALDGARQALDKFSSIADNAKSAGLDPEVFQALAYQAEQSGVAFDAFSGGLDAFNKNAGLAVENKGRMVTALKALNPELLANIQAATTQEQRVRLAADAIAAAGTASEKAALSTALFGDAGFKLADAFAGGAAAIDETAAKAKALGLIIDRDLIARSEALGDELSTATQIMDLQFKQAMVDLAPILISTAQLAGNLAAGVNYLTESMQELGARGTARLEQDLTAIDATLAQANATMGAGYVGTMGVQMDPAAATKLQAERDAIAAELKRRAVDQLRIDLSRPKPADEVGPGSGAGTGTRNAAAEATLRQAEAVKKLVSDLQFEKQIVGETALEQQILNTLRSTGVDAASAEGLAIRGLVTELDAQKTAMHATADAMREFEGLAENALTSFIGDLREGKSGAEALGNAMNSILDNVIQIGVQSLVGGLFGGGGIGKLFGFANGGIAAHGKPLKTFARGGVSNTAAIFGEAGPEAAVPLPDGRSIPVKFMGPPGPVASRSPQAGGALTVHVSLDSDMLHAEVVNTAGQVVARAAPSIIRKANHNAPLTVADRQMRFGS